VEKSVSIRMGTTGKADPAGIVPAPPMQPVRIQGLGNQNIEGTVGGMP
jgi:hypothetical protein